MSIRTPEDNHDDDRGWFWLPFSEGEWYQGATYPGHSDFATDWNLRTKLGGWLDDRGKPVRAMADGTVADVQPADGTVFINHWGGTYRSEYRHMEPVLVKVGQKVERGDIIGRIGDAGNAPNGPHLHTRQYKKVSGVWKPIKQSYEGKEIGPSVWNSDSQPGSWDPPAPVLMQGPPPKATWQSAFKESERLRERADRRVDALTIKVGAVTEERDAARAAEQLAKDAADGLRTELTAAQAALKACQEQPTPSCDAAIAQATAELTAKIENAKAALA